MGKRKRSSKKPFRNKRCFPQVVDTTSLYIRVYYKRVVYKRIGDFTLYNAVFPCNTMRSSCLFEMNLKKSRPCSFTQFYHYCPSFLLYNFICENLEAQLISDHQNIDSTIAKDSLVPHNNGSKNTEISISIRSEIEELL